MYISSDKGYILSLYFSYYSKQCTKSTKPRYIFSEGKPSNLQ